MSDTDAQLYYEDVNPGDELPALVKYPTTMQLVKFAAAQGDYHQIHYDKDFALAQGLPGIIIHGWLGLSFLGQMVTDWIGERGDLVKLGGSYRGMNRVHEDVFCYGTVTGKERKEGRNLVHIDVWMENPAGERTIVGNATVALPSRNTEA